MKEHRKEAIAKKFQSLLENCNEKQKFMVLLAWYGCLSSQEVVSTRIQDFDIKKSTLKVAGRNVKFPEVVSEEFFQYVVNYKPFRFIFFSNDRHKAMDESGLRKAIPQIAKRAGFSWTYQEFKIESQVFHILGSQDIKTLAEQFGYENLDECQKAFGL